jgi:hypothetical protein
MDIIWAFYCGGVGSTALGLHLIISYYLKIRVSQVNTKLSQLIIAPNKKLTYKSVLREHNEVCNQIHLYNDFWSKFLFLICFFYIPTDAFLLYNFIYEDLEFIVVASMILLLIEISFYVFASVYTAAIISSHVQKSYPLLNKLMFEVKHTQTKLDVKIQAL